MLKFLFGVFIGWVLFGAPAYAEEQEIGVKTAVYVVSSPCFESAYDAIYPQLTAARRLMVKNGWEYGGMVTRRTVDGFYCSSAPATSEHKTRMTFVYSVPDGHTVNAFYHSHPGNTLATYLFSGTDVFSACHLGATGLVVTETRLVLAFFPNMSDCLRDPIQPVGGKVVGMVEP